MADRNPRARLKVEDPTGNNSVSGVSGGTLSLVPGGSVEAAISELVERPGLRLAAYPHPSQGIGGRLANGAAAWNEYQVRSPWLNRAIEGIEEKRAAEPQPLGPREAPEKHRRARVEQELKGMAEEERGAFLEALGRLRARRPDPGLSSVAKNRAARRTHAIENRLMGWKPGPISEQIPRLMEPSPEKALLEYDLAELRHAAGKTWP